VRDHPETPADEPAAITPRKRSWIRLWLILAIVVAVGLLAFVVTRTFNAPRLTAAALVGSYSTQLTWHCAGSANAFPLPMRVDIEKAAITIMVGSERLTGAFDPSNNSFTTALQGPLSGAMSFGGRFTRAQGGEVRMTGTIETSFLGGVCTGAVDGTKDRGRGN
jgi:hypothetical protein